VAPDALLARWQVVALDPQQTVTGRRTYRDRSVVARLYREVCGTTLVKYDHPLPINCPAAFGDGRYHLTFTRRGRVVLRVMEEDEGCQFLWIEGHRDLGYGFEVLYLPPGVPTVLSLTK
jgi:hypothetical protein